MTETAEGTVPPSHDRGSGLVREARLRPEFAALYPWIRSDIWYIAASLERPPLSEELARPGERALPEAHFEFRGGAEHQGGSTADRASDRL